MERENNRKILGLGSEEEGEKRRGKRIVGRREQHVQRPCGKRKQSTLPGTERRPRTVEMPQLGLLSIFHSVPSCTRQT